ncbi:YifB family Mg chelatase-like AAA ATPase [Spongiibacter sp.]|uniref:YifB family Mg chelatase-like AAA ATPase n=1 Tax=Spongiibacter sp. TaxID=2024860 RepID=UPI003565B471
MPLATVYSRARLGVDAPLITIEVHLSAGLPAFNIVGLPEATVREAKDRVRSALINSHFDFPVSRITVNLAPADLPKEGGRFDLPIAIGILIATGQLKQADTEGYEFIGELSLSGKLRSVAAALPAAIACNAAGKRLVLPHSNGELAGLLAADSLCEAGDLLSVAGFINGQQTLTLGRDATPPPPPDYPDLSDVRGQLIARRGLEIAAAGGHSLLFSGPPGTGKSLLASRLPGILPALSDSEQRDIAIVQSIAGKTLRLQRPFRSPHHTASAAALVGGGSSPRPGEISLAHRGVLFLDELPEYPRKVLDVLREPLESGEVVISRATQQLRFPASFQLIAAMNPCPCGFDGDPQLSCRCTPDQIARYRGRISGPLLDRIDLRLRVNRMAAGELQDAPPGESSAAVRRRVQDAHSRQLARQHCNNVLLSAAQVAEFCALDNIGKNFMRETELRLNLSARGQHRLLKTARTIADLANSEHIALPHLQEAALYRGEL